MKKVFLPLLAVGILINSCGEVVNDEAAEKVTTTVDSTVVEVEEVASYFVDGYDYYGIKELTADDAVSVSQMKAAVDSLGAFEGKIQAKLTGVCKKAGCWVTIQDGESDIRVMFGSHDFFVPVDTDENLEVVLEGAALIDTVSIDMQKHFLDDAVEAGETVTQEEYDAITEDLIEVSFVASGILLKK